MTLSPIQRALNDFREGRFVVVVDDEDRENEGDLCMAAEKVTPEAINFMAKHARGLICLALTEERLDHLQIPLMVDQNSSSHATAFTVSVEARTGVTTGISAADRARTIQVAMADETTPQDLVRPGHVFPLRARRGGVLVRSGHTEATVDFARLAGLKPGGVLCEIMNDDGTMARLPDLRVFAAEHKLALVSIADLIHYRVTHESLVKRLATHALNHPTWGHLTIFAYGTSLDDREHLVIIRGDFNATSVPLVRVQASGPLSGVLDDMLGSSHTGVSQVLERMVSEEASVLVCLSRASSRVSLSQRIDAMHSDSASPAESESGGVSGVQREFGVGAQILRDLGLQRIRVLTDHPRRLTGLEGYGLHVDEWVPLNEQVNEIVSSKPHLRVIG